MKIIWKTKKVKQLFNLKDKNPYPSSVIYEGICTCGENYIGETIKNLKTRTLEHENPKNSSEPAKHIWQNPTHTFIWKVVINASHNSRVRKNLEASYIANKKPSLNDQLESKKLLLFRNGVT